ncbi:hypothetical protein [Hydrogenophaga sp. SL48]|uniref:hypothetical protein n=1 Tax=Hydrogenophaga sp. SL48 TaxID=2806347 RepID=UPI001F306685|nr:hypothetical protein [Hydrogenophaga sp. SL48]UJW81168.1 hypothetical protein IM738_25805 [Hydrogenophaga sp. SL48]
MKLEGAVALVFGADSALGAAVVRGLFARGVAKVYADAPLESCEISLSRSVPLFVDIGKQARAATLARDLTDVTLLVNCLVAEHSIASPHEGSDQPALHPQGPTVGRTLKLIDAVAPVLAANGGGAIVNVMSVLHADQLSATKAPTNARPLAEWMLADGLQGRLAAQRTQLLFFGAQLVVGAGEQMLDDQRALAAHIATRMLHQLDAGDGHDRIGFARYR